jgi:Fur family ferric uptake transcriptional regulator
MSTMPPRRRTVQRNAIRSVLEQHLCPMGPHEIRAEARRQVPSLGMATVYRTLNQLMEQGLCRAVHLPGETTRYEAAQSTHHHYFNCRNCGGVYTIHACPGGFERLLPEGFQLDAHELVLYGHCPDCVEARR